MRRNTDDREVGGAAAEIDDEADLLARHLPFIVEGSGNRFVLKCDVPEAFGADGGFHLLLRVTIGDRIVVDIIDRAADDDAVEGFSDLNFGATLHLADEAADDLQIRDDALLDAQLFLGQRRAENGLERAHHAAVGARDVFGDGGSTIDGPVAVEIEEDDAGDGRTSGLKRQQACCGVAAGDGEGRIGGPEIEAAMAQGLSHGVARESGSGSIAAFALSPQ